MQIKEKFTNFERTQAISDYLAKRLSHLDKFIKDNSALCEVELGKTTNHHKSGDIFRAEINLKIKGKSFRAVSEKDDLYSAIDIVKDEMVNELHHHKDKKVSIARRGGAKVKSIIKGLFNRYN